MTVNRQADVDHFRAVGEQPSLAAELFVLAAPPPCGAVDVFSLPQVFVVSVYCS